MSNPTLVTGTYRHYKGNLYRVLYTARHSETEEWFVVYHPLYGQDCDKNIWIRPLAMFVESVNHNGEQVPRFCLESV